MSGSRHTPEIDGGKSMISMLLRHACAPVVVLVILIGMACAPSEPPESYTEAQIPVTAPTPDELRAATYEGIFDYPVTLIDGRYEGEPFVEGGASAPAAGFVEDFLLTGDLDGDGRNEAVVLLWENSGGSGTRSYLAAMGRSQGGIENLGTILIGDRVQVRSASLVGDAIELELVEAGPEDAACCPTQKTTKTWGLGPEGLMMTASEVTGTLSLADLQGPEWVLTKFEMNEPVPEGVGITFMFDGDRVTGSGGCNRYFGAVTGDVPGELAFGPMGSTQMACPDPAGALEHRYLTTLGNTTRYQFLAGNLVLTGTTGEQTMTLIFTPREPGISGS